MKEEQLNLQGKIVNGKKKRNALDFIILFWKKLLEIKKSIS